AALPREPPDEPPGVPERRRVLARVPDGAAGSGPRGIAVDLDAFAPLEPLAVAVGALRADHDHLVAGARERHALLPDAPVGRYGHVLDEQECAHPLQRTAARRRREHARRRLPGDLAERLVRRRRGACTVVSMEPN